MGFEGFIWLIPVLAMLIATCTGPVFAVYGWMKIAADSRATSGKKAPAALIAFSAAVLANPASIGILWAWDQFSLPQWIFGIESPRLILSCSLIVSFLLVIASFVLALRDSSPARGIVMTGSLVLLFVNVLGLVLFFFAELRT